MSIIGDMTRKRQKLLTVTMTLTMIIITSAIAETMALMAPPMAEKIAP